MRRSVVEVLGWGGASMKEKWRVIPRDLRKPLGGHASAIRMEKVEQVLVWGRDKVMWSIWPGDSRGNFRRAVVNLEEVLYSNWKYRLYNQSWIIISTLPLLDSDPRRAIYLLWVFFFFNFILSLLPGKMELLFHIYYNFVFICLIAFVHSLFYDFFFSTLF